MPAPTPTLVSRNVGLPRVVAWRDAQVSARHLQTVDRRLRLRSLNLDGDGQADLAVHGGVDKAVYAFPSEHYPWWQAELGLAELGWGQFGENFSTTGLFETTVHIGDRFRVGSAGWWSLSPAALLQAERAGFRACRYAEALSGRPLHGVYLRVVQEGEVGAGDTFELVALDPNGVTVADITELYLAEDPSVELLQRALQVADLPDGWRGEFESRLA